MAELSDETRADVAVIDRVIARDPSAIAELYDRHSRLLYGLILRILRERGEAEEVLQEVFLSVWTRANTYQPALGAPVAWLVRIARNRAIDRLRANGVRLHAIEASQAPPVPENPEYEASRAERQHDVARALDALPADQRLLIEEAYYRGLTQSELAARYNLPLGTVKTRVRTGLLTLRQQLPASLINR